MLKNAMIYSICRLFILLNYLCGNYWRCCIYRVTICAAYAVWAAEKFISPWRPKMLKCRFRRHVTRSVTGDSDFHGSPFTIATRIILNPFSIHYANLRSPPLQPFITCDSVLPVAPRPSVVQWIPLPFRPGLARRVIELNSVDHEEF